MFPVKIAGKKVTPLTGVRWGYTFDEPINQFKAIPVTRLRSSRWNQHLDKLKKHYPNWQFEKAP
jgi:hypothetical protein